MVLDGDAHVILTDVEIDGNRAGDGGGGFSAEGRLSLTATRADRHRQQDLRRGRRRLHRHRAPRRDQGLAVPAQPGRLPRASGAGRASGDRHAGRPGLRDRRQRGRRRRASTPRAARSRSTGSTFAENIATEEGGGISIDNFGKVEIKDTVVRDNKAGADGGGIENSGMRTTFDRLRVTGNKATIDGGGIYNSSSDEFLVIDSTMQGNTALDGGGFANAPDADLIIKQSSIIGNFARMPGLDDGGLRLDGGEGGGFWSKADGNAIIENTTISTNKAAISGGGAFHDADGELKFSNVTVWRNSAPYGGGIGVVESDFSPEVPPKANESVILRNSVVGGSLAGGSCDWYVTSEGGNVTGGSVPRVPTPGLVRTDVPDPDHQRLLHPPGARHARLDGRGPARPPRRRPPRRPRRQRRADAHQRGAAREPRGRHRAAPLPRDRPARRRAPAERPLRRRRLRVRGDAAGRRRRAARHRSTSPGRSRTRWRRPRSGSPAPTTRRPRTS